MAMTMQVDVVSAEESIYSGIAEFVAAPAEMGEVGVYARHAPMLTRLKPGSVRVKVANSGEEEIIYVSGGLIEIQPHMITVLADTAIRGKDLDEAKANETKRRAEEAMRNQADKLDYAKAQAELAQAIAQLQVIERIRKKKGH